MAAPGLGAITYQGQVQDAWLDHNGHMNLGYFPIAFVDGTASLFKKAGVGLDAKAEHGDTMYMLETHLTYRQELLARRNFYIETRLLGFDHNKMQFLHWMYDDETGGLVATYECLALNVNAGLRKAAPFRDEVRAALWKIYDEHAHLPLGDGVAGRAILQLGVPEAAG